MTAGREEIITQILERFEELTDPTSGPLGVEGSGERVPLMPLTYTPTVREVERLMQRMREERRSQWWHVTERYTRSHQALKDVPVKRKAKNGKTATVIERQLVTTWDAAVRLEKVRRGITWLATEWSLPHEPMLPQELLAAA